MKLHLDPKRTAVVVIDIQSPISSANFSYLHGSVDEGLNRVASLLSSSRKKGFTRILVEQPARDLGPTSLLLKKAAGPGVLVIEKTQPSAFSSPRFRNALATRNITHLIVAGFRRIECIYCSVMDGISSGYKVATSDELLFGASIRQESDGSNPAENDAALDFYRTGTLYFSSAQSIIDCINQSARQKVLSRVRG